VKRVSNDHRRAPEWLWLDLRCYTCDADLHLNDYQSDLWCSAQCRRTPPLSDELTSVLDKLIWHNLYHVPSLDVADAMLSWKPNEYGRGSVADGIRSVHWRKRRLAELHELLKGQHPPP
jgi:hypothetical protein